MQKKLTEMFNTTNTFLKDIYEEQNNKIDVSKMRELSKKMMSIIFILAIIYFLFNLIFTKNHVKYKRTFKSTRRR
tara:strand:- start:905 stop:1129 length:225 start_codon:yes stop_codon:yes gene_type:complete